MATADVLPQYPSIGYSSAYGGVPNVPSPIATQGAAVGGNIGNLGSLYSLAGPTNQFNQQQAAVGLNTNLPGYQSMIGQSSQNIGSLLQGQIPQDVANQIAQQAAERGTAIGSVGSPNANTALLRAMGLTSLGLQQQGEQNLTTAIGRTPQAAIFDPSKFFVTPEQQQAAQTAADLYGSAPNPQAAALAARNAAGAGSLPRLPTPIVQGQGSPGLPFPSEPGQVVGVNPGTGGLTYGGQTYYGGSNPNTALSNWNQFYGGLTKSPYQPGTTNLLPGQQDLSWTDPLGLNEFSDWSDYGTVNAPGSDMSYNIPDQSVAPMGFDYGDFG